MIRLSTRYLALLAAAGVIASATDAAAPTETFASGKSKIARRDYVTLDQAGGRDALRKRLLAEIAAGIADPVGNAGAAARAGRFDLIAGKRPIGVTCFTPSRLPPGTLFEVSGNDRDAAYAAAYNRALIDLPAYPYADVCRPGDDGAGSEIAVSQAARPVAKAPIGLHEAARRGTAKDLKKWIRKSPIDAVDAAGMTPLAWATARNNEAAVAALLKAGASAWAGNGERSAVWWAARLGRRGLFMALQGRPGRPFASWPDSYVAAARNGGDSLVATLIAIEPHASIVPGRLQDPLPPVEAMEVVLQQRPAGVADALLLRALEQPREPQLDLARLALKYGADPNATERGAHGRSALDMAVACDDPAAPEAVDLLLRAGADVNRLSGDARPVWTAVRGMMTSNEKVPSERTMRSRQIFETLLAARANLNLPDRQGRPPIWFLLFPDPQSPGRLDPRVTRDMLKMLSERGVDLNASFNGTNILAEVERQAGPQAFLTRALRSLGARS